MSRSLPRSLTSIQPKRMLRREKQNAVPMSPEDRARERRAIAKALAMSRANYDRREPSMAYFIICGSFVKIGAASDPESRMADMRIGNPFDLALALVLDGGVPLEKELHKRFQASRHRQEWFHLSDDVRAFILESGGTLP